MAEEIKRIPEHVSIIMDGNGRWAKERGKKRLEGHHAGIESVRAVTEASVEYGIKYLSLFAFSEENWNRPEEEVDGLMKMMAEAMQKEYDTLMKNSVKFVVLGNRERLSPVLLHAIDSLMDATKDNVNTTMIIFLSYSGKWDILQAAKKLAREAASDEELLKRLDSFSEKDFSRYLVTAGIPDPDLIIRTSGEQRISNYLLWQAAYSEFYITDTLWPDFRKEQFRAALSAYEKRDRRFGKVK